MDRAAETKSKYTRNTGTSSKSSEPTVRKRLQEPPKFYSKNYLKRYNQSEVKGASARPLSPGKKLSCCLAATTSTTTTTTATDQQTRSKDSSANSNAAVITISTTILKLADEAEGPVTAQHQHQQQQQQQQRQQSEANSVNPYNRAPVPRPAANMNRYRQPSEQDYRYSLTNAMTAVRSSYFKDGGEGACTEAADSLATPLHYVEACYAEWAKHDTFKRVKPKLEEAVKRHKIFLLRGELPRLKEALEERGWIQKYESSRTRSLPYGSTASLEAKSLGDVRQPDGGLNERALVFALLQHVQPDFIWDCRNDFVEWDRGIASNVLLNRFYKPSLYTSKLGMAHVLQEAHWLHETDVADVLFPRSYNPSRELAALSRDFRRCTAVALLRCFVERVRNSSPEPADTADTPQGDKVGEVTLALECIEFAIRCCEDHVSELEHGDIDVEQENDVSDEEWRLFSDDCDRYLYKLGGLASLPKSDPERLEACFAAAQNVLDKLEAIDPQFKLNGERNIWIVKPSNLCCGSGIFMTHDFKIILRKVESKPRDYYVVQKYIERPFLVYGTKFDIRQWFLVTSTFPMTIWSFREALLRFSSKPYSLGTYHEAIHICNTAVQERYDWDRRRRRSRVPGAPPSSAPDEPVEQTVRDQGWDCEKLNEYLKSVGYDGEPYYEKIYPKMSQAIVLTMLAAQDCMDRRRCSFELYGADFMVMEDLSVWLIEINTNPRMHPPSSRITQRLYGSVLDSLVKVIMDQPLSPGSDTGGFELVYRQSVPEMQPYLGPCLFAFGKTMTLHENTASRKRAGGNPGPWPKHCRAWTAPPLAERLREPKVVDFIACLNNVHKDGDPK